MPYLSFVQAFEDLWQQISAVAEDICIDCPAQIPNEHTRRIASDLPPFLVDTPASTRVRTAYVQSLISGIINNRVFQPFLFTHEDLEDTFTELAEYLRGKSTRKETFWRQRTLHAAFSCLSSKDKINEIAGHIVEEIFAAIKPFTDESKRTQMRAAVKQIVKKAAETWRYARIELSRITASTATGTSEGGNGEQLLSIFPRIQREPLPNGFRPDTTDDPGCVYTPGQTLSRKSSAVLARRVELGEISATPAAAQTESGTTGCRPDVKRPRKMSSEIASRARRFEPRSISPLVSAPESSQASRGKAAIPPDKLPDIHLGEQHKHGEEWETDSESSSHQESAGGRELGKERRDESSKVTRAKQAADSSPLQSPVHTQSPQLSRRPARTTDLSSEEDRASEVTERPGALPDWRGTGGTQDNIPAPPGAYGW
ncbi:MAG: hypothetical protein Q9210_002745 [Variospora velana]